MNRVCPGGRVAGRTLQPRLIELEERSEPVVHFHTLHCVASSPSDLAARRERIVHHAGRQRLAAGGVPLQEPLCDLLLSERLEEQALIVRITGGTRQVLGQRSCRSFDPLAAEDQLMEKPVRLEQLGRMEVLVRTHVPHLVRPHGRNEVAGVERQTHHSRRRLPPVQRLHPHASDLAEPLRRTQRQMLPNEVVQEGDSLSVATHTSQTLTPQTAGGSRRPASLVRGGRPVASLNGKRIALRADSLIPQFRRVVQQTLELLLHRLAHVAGDRPVVVRGVSEPEDLLHLRSQQVKRVLRLLPARMRVRQLGGTTLIDQSLNRLGSLLVIEVGGPHHLRLLGPPSQERSLIRLDDLTDLNLIFETEDRSLHARSHTALSGLLIQLRKIVVDPLPARIVLVQLTLYHRHPIRHSLQLAGTLRIGGMVRLQTAGDPHLVGNRMLSLSNVTRLDVIDTPQQRLPRLLRQALNLLPS